LAGSEAGRPFKVFKCKGGWRVEGPNGKTRGRRKRLSAAKDLAYRLSIGMKRVPESHFILSNWPALHIRKSLTSACPFVIRTSDGIAIKRFKRRYQAEWWLEKYNSRRLTRASQLSCGNDEPRPLDQLEERWLIADRTMCFETRVSEIIDLLKAGMA